MSLSISQRHQIVSVRTAVSVDSRTTRTQNHVSCARLASSARLGCHRRSQKLLRAAHVVQVSSKIQQGKQHAFKVGGNTKAPTNWPLQGKGGTHFTIASIHCQSLASIHHLYRCCQSILATERAPIHSGTPPKHVRASYKLWCE